MLTRLHLLLSGLAICLPASFLWPEPYASATLSELVLGNDAIERRYRIDGARLSSLSISGKSAELSFVAASEEPSFPWEEMGEPESVEWSKLAVDASPTTEPHLLVSGEFSYPDFKVRREFLVFATAPAIQHRIWIKMSAAAGIETREQLNAFPWKLDQVGLPGAHWRASSVEFFDITDDTNNLTQRETRLAFTKTERARGNIHWVEPLGGDGGIFWVKEAPGSAAQLNYPGFDFEIDQARASVVGSGIDALEIEAEQWSLAYGVAVGVYSGGFDGMRIALRRYQKALRPYLCERDAMVMMNTWGDRNKDASIGDAFLRREIAAAKRLGLTHFQIDDGWQAGLSQNSASAAGEKWAWWEAEDWLAHPERLPQGFGPIADYAREQGIKLGLWFNPTRADEYVNWERDAEIVLGLYRRYGIRYFKIDGMELPTKRADDRFRRFCERVVDASNGEIVLHLDATAGQRGGYHYLNRFGVVFLENRYTDWVSYYPHWTLRNLWQLGHFVPPERLQIEFLNLWRNAEKYPADDPLAPREIPFDYAFATTMMAQPLAWFEASGLPEQAFEISAMVRRYSELMASMHQGVILPIGCEPDGYQWTGFQSMVSDTTGYLLALRENHPENHFRLSSLLPQGREVRLEPLWPSGDPHLRAVGSGGTIEVVLDAPFSFRLFKYTVLD